MVNVGFNDLKTKNPEIAAEWNYEKNNGLRPEDFSYGSKKKVWWKGKCGHEWYMPIGARTNSGQGCPYCGGRRAIKGENDFASQAKDLLVEWNWEKNVGVKPDEVRKSSNKKVWWKGKCGHEWYMSIDARTLQGQGCPYCGGKKVLKGFNDFASQAKDLLVEWNWEKNKDIKPDEVTVGSSKKVWWICDKGHTWKAGIYSRARQKNGCPYCSGMYIWKGFNDLKTVAPAYLEYWDYEKNTITPEEVGIGSGRKVWWVCFFGHSWKATIHSIVGGKTGCPICSLWQHSSFAEQIVYYYVHLLFPSAINGYRPDYLDRTSEIDIYIPEIRIGIEYDGMRWHTCKKVKQDREKTEKLNRNGVRLYRIREPECEPLNDSSMEIYTDTPRGNYVYMEDAVKELIGYLCIYSKKSIISIDEFVNIDRDILKVRAQFNTIMMKRSLAVVNPQLAKEWDYEKNEGLTPESVAAYSALSVWWRCGLGHSYKATIDTRNTKKSGCPYCSFHKVLKGFNDLESQYPKQMIFWDYEKNSIIPSRVSCKSSKSYWWKCNNGHSYKMAVITKVERGGKCPYCSGRLAIKGKTDLNTLFPDIVAEWDYEKNTKIDPKDVLPYSSQKVWWVCSHCHYSWKTSIAMRTSKNTGCPKCLNRVVDETENLLVSNPEIAKEWDYDNNSPLSPDMVKKGSHKSVWWICSKCGYNWQAVINNRVRGTGCPRCAIRYRGQRVTLDKYPSLCSEWNEGKNGESYINVASKSNKKRWWTCSTCGYEWQAPPSSRTKGIGCPACSGRVATKDNNIGKMYSKLCEEWDYEKNGDNTPLNTLPKSRKKIWWKCKSCGHEWQAPPYNRVIGSGCPMCNKIKRK